MTTIAYKDGRIAYDSMICSGELITDLQQNKCHHKRDILFFMCGAMCDYEHFFNRFFEGKFRPDKQEADGSVPEATAIVEMIDGSLWTVAVDEDNQMWREEIPLTKIEAMGSGKMFALAAMDCGKSAKEAVEIAAGRDVYTGGKINEYVIKHFDLIQPEVEEGPIIQYNNGCIEDAYSPAQSKNMVNSILKGMIK